MPQIDFMGELHEFPDGWNDKQIGDALITYVANKPASEVVNKPDTSSAMRTERLNVGALTEYVPEDELFPELPEMNLNQKMFVDTIAEIETGGLKQKEIRTKVNGSGSSAYGRYQITHGLLTGTMETYPDLFEPSELRAATELTERQSIALAVGGKDAPSYREGGDKYSIGKKWAKAYGYEDVDEFVNAFDYGGDLGLSGNEDFQVLYESFARKMLLKQLKEAGNDPIEAASQWHGGAKWQSNKKHVKQTRNYQEKYKRVLESRTREVEGN